MTKITDLIGMVTASICGIHCALSPLLALVMVFSPTIDAHVHGDGMLDMVCIVAAPVFAGLSMLPVYFKHRLARPLLVFGLGYLVALIGYWQEHNFGLFLHSSMMVAGAILMTWAHRLNAKCECRGYSSD